ncbi:hypothetical protein Tco_1068539 [Tanacetum coccineum]|uniref:Integrase, catalytic region, zinc finger, CCHC-type, peptidase aspartic, catalytic n=1 Tax=Tanacetum coccineum TaxID=301880 RepID=A0ABQ5HG00_9ASTR
MNLIHLDQVISFSVFYEDFSEVDALPSTNNEDKVFNPGILIHENLFEVTNCAIMEKNVKKISFASLILEDFNPPLYELPFHKEVPGLGALLWFLFVETKYRTKIFTGLSLLKDAPSTINSPSSSKKQPPILHQGVAVGPTLEDNPFAHADNDPFVNTFALEPGLAESSSGDVSTAEPNQVHQPHAHIRKWTKDHPIDNVVGNPSRPVSTRKQLATDALWCFYHSVLSKVEPNNFNTAVTKACWFEAMQEEIY